ncbi:hypothetical protein SAY86_029450 [Trapa natans]|uniref:Bet v I/Major latex protein domain-containing protein n=1 Tax=Trapa natans TaxID=22666 RepID=A0AAN7M269_TRANT|nr:hypothetical protein SAY86_029450 [Trapa natans]
MGVTCFNQEFTAAVAPSRMFKALILDSHNLIPKLVPEGIKSIQLLQGDGGVGSIKQTQFAEDGHIKSLKYRVDALDTEKFTSKYTLIEGDIILDRLEKIVYEVKFEAKSDGGCVCKMTSEYHVKGDTELKEEEIKQGKDKAMGLYKVAEEYLVANPNVYA